MNKKLLVAVDGSEHASKAEELAADMAKAEEAELMLLHVVPRGMAPGSFEQWAEVEGVTVEEMQARYRQTYGDVIIRDAEARARKHGAVKISTEVRVGNPAEEIVSYANSVGADMIFLGSRGLSDVQGLFLGSVSHRVLHLAPCTCILVK